MARPIFRIPPAPWMVHAACRDHENPELWFPSVHEKGMAAAIKAAKEVCKTCPVRIQCLEYALENHEQVGIWGGMNARERRREASRRRMQAEQRKRYLPS